MANTSKLTVRVSSTRGGSTISYSTSGRYVSLTTNELAADMPGQPIQPTADEQTFWSSVLAAVTKNISTT